MDLVDVLVEVLDRGASDLHLTVGSPPVIRVSGKLIRLDYPALDSNDTRDLIYSILTQDQRQRMETDWEIDFSYSVPGRARFRVNTYFQRNSLGAAFQLIPAEIKNLERSDPAAFASQDGCQTARFCTCDRTDRQRQIHNPGCC